MLHHDKEAFRAERSACNEQSLAITEKEPVSVKGCACFINVESRHPLLGICSLSRNHSSTPTPPTCTLRFEILLQAHFSPVARSNAMLTTPNWPFPMTCRRGSMTCIRNDQPDAHPALAKHRSHLYHFYKNDVAESSWICCS